MTKQELVDRYRHRIGGLLADAATHDRKGGHLAMWLRCQFEEIDKIIGQMHDELFPEIKPEKKLEKPPAPSANGHPAPRIPTRPA